MHSACFVIFYLVCPKRRRRRTCKPWDLQESSLSVSLFWNRTRRRSWKASVQSQQSPNKRDAFSFPPPSFLSSTRGFRPDVTPSTCHCCNSCRSTWAVILKTVYHNIPKQHMSTRAAWNIRFLNINAISSLRNSGFNCPSLQFYWLYG